MKTIKEYLSSNNDQTLLFENIDTAMSLQEVYEVLYDKMFDDQYQLNEGLGDWLRKLAAKGDEIDKRATELKKSATDKINNMSDAAKTAIENAKKNAGESWGKVKGTYTAAVATIDTALRTAKTSVENLVKAAGIDMSAFEGTAAQVLSNLYGQGKTKLANSFTDTKAAAAMQTLLLGAILCKNNNIDTSQILEILSAAGIK